MEGIIIRPLIAVNPSDNKGMTYEWCKGIETRQITICFRKKGVVSGDHYHTGNDPSKNPEKFLILNGAVRFVACNGRETLDNIIEEGVNEIIIQHSIIHALIPLDKGITFLEQRMTVYNPEDNDTFPSEQFLDYLNDSRKINHGAFNKYKTIVRNLRLMQGYG